MDYLFVRALSAAGLSQCPVEVTTPLTFENFPVWRHMAWASVRYGADPDEVPHHLRNNKPEGPR